MDSTQIEDALLDAIDIQIRKRLHGLNFNHYKEGKIISKNSDGSYNVVVNEIVETLFAREGSEFGTGDVVLICVPNGNLSYEFIDLKVPY